MPLTHNNKVLLRSLAIGSGSLSVIAGVLMVYWFLKLKNRSFRHQLVMLLVMSDALKACSEIVYPARTLLSDSLASDTLCTAMGFLCNVFVESADMAVLVIAVHTALCIFKPPPGGVSSERAGLYPWRYYVYGIWASFGIVMASLAFLNKDKAYTNAVSWCFLPIRPFYWRIALSWAPRYVILLFIFVLYLSIFIYVKRKFNSFRRAFAMTLEEESSGAGIGSMADYQMNYNHAGISPDQELNFDMHMLADPIMSPAIISDRPSMPERASSQGYRPTLVFLNSDDRFNFELRRESILTINEKDMPRKKVVAEQISHNVDESLVSETPTLTSPRLISRRPTMLNLAKTMHLKTFNIPSGDVTPVALPTPQQRPLDPLREERARIVKQLKHLFIFPIVYFLMWLLPFAFHLTNYHDKFAKNPIVPLAAAASFMIPLHGFIDVCIYARNEKPWRSWRFSHGRRLPQRKSIDAALMAKDEKLLSHTTAQQVPHIDAVALRQQQEIIEAQEKKLKRQSQHHSAAMVSGTPDWWDLELKQQTTRDDNHELDV